MTIADQLNSGIRCLDLRCQVYEDDLWMYHDWRNLNTRLSDLLNEVSKFLKARPQEAIIRPNERRGRPARPAFRDFALR